MPRQWLYTWQIRWREKGIMKSENKSSPSSAATASVAEKEEIWMILSKRQVYPSSIARASLSFSLYWIEFIMHASLMLFHQVISIQSHICIWRWVFSYFTFSFSLSLSLFIQLLLLQFSVLSFERGKFLLLFASGTIFTLFVWTSICCK